MGREVGVHAGRLNMS